MLKVNNIEVVYNDIILALRGISIRFLTRKSLLCSGATEQGNHTTLKAIAGILPLEDGEIEGGMIEFDGKRIDQKSPEEIVKMGDLRHSRREGYLL